MKIRNIVAIIASIALIIITVFVIYYSNIIKYEREITPPLQNTTTSKPSTTTSNQSSTLIEKFEELLKYSLIVKIISQDKLQIQYYDSRESKWKIIERDGENLITTFKNIIKNLESYGLIFGEKNSSVIVVFFEDLWCPFCSHEAKLEHDLIEKVLNDELSNVEIIIMHLIVHPPPNYGGIRNSTDNSCTLSNLTSRSICIITGVIPLHVILEYLYSTGNLTLTNKFIKQVYDEVNEAYVKYTTTHTELRLPDVKDYESYARKCGLELLNGSKVLCRGICINFLRRVLQGHEFTFNYLGFRGTPTTMVILRNNYTMIVWEGCIPGIVDLKIRESECLGYERFLNLIKFLTSQ